MFSPLKHWHRLSHAGTENLSPAQSRPVILTNRVCIILALISIGFTFPWVLKGNAFMVAINVVLIMAYMGVIWMNSKGWYDIPKILTILCISTPVFVVTGMVGQKSLLHFSLIPVAGFSALLFDRKEKLKIFLAIGYPLLLLSILIVSDFKLFPNLMGNDLAMLPAYDYILNFGIIFSTMYYFYRAYSAAEDNHQEAQRLLEEQRANAMHASKMVALGEMAGGIAHEINTPLFVIRSLADKLHSELTQKKYNEEKLLHYSSQMIEMCKKMASIVKSLSFLSRTSSPGPLLAVDLCGLIQETLVICQHRFYLRGISIQVDCPQDLPPVKGRPVEISQVLINLLNNAYDAVVDVESPVVKVHAVKLDDSIQVIVEDNGPGIPEHVQNRVFENFFTTKEPGKGTGVGLAISRKLIEANDGQIRFSSRPGSTRFVLELALHQTESL